MLRRAFKISVWLLGVILLLLVLFFCYVRIVARVVPPTPGSLAALNQEVVKSSSGLAVIGNNWFRRSESGLYELYVEGDPFDRGVANGKLTKDLVRYQEVVFTEQIRRLVPNQLYLKLLTYFVGWFNRDLTDNIPEEYQLEIFGVSQSASHDFDYIASPYQRILNYHAAHDIGHALQNMSLVGCTSFATWGSNSADSSLIIGRNFDFYVGDDFAENKIIAFYKPTQGYKFMMVTFGGMTGVLSGMNDEGLTVTINAAKSDIPSGSATPVSLVAREILQYAATIKEAYQIAKKRKMFVAESFLIGSARDGKAAIIEKTHIGIDFFESDSSAIICTNHFQGDTLGNTQLNKDHMKTSASPYRFERVAELLGRQGKNTVTRTAAILRNQKGLRDIDIGMGNEKSINQLVAHHSIIFQPERKLVWISTAPWQLGKYVCYDFNRVFESIPTNNAEIYEGSLTIPEDPFRHTESFENYVKFSKYRFPFNDKSGLIPDSLVVWNPNSYHAYMLAGDYYMEKKNWKKASMMYETGLSKVISTGQEREYMQVNLRRCKEIQE